LKRVDPEEVDTYKALGKSLVPLPSPRSEEASELYLALEKWEDAPAFMEQTVIETHPAKSQGSAGNTPGEITVPEREFLSNTRHEGEAEERIFLSRLRLRGPVSPQLHAGKYVVMTMSRSNLKAIDYAVVYVTILQKSFNATVHNIIVYCVVPISFILLTVFVSLYFFLSRRNKDLNHSANRRGGTLFSPVGRGNSLPSVKKDYTSIVRATPRSSVFSNGNTLSNGSKTSSCLPPYASHSSSTPSQWNSNPHMAAPSTATSPITQTNSIHNFQSHLSQPTNQLPPSASTFYNYSGLQSMASQQPTYWHPPAPSIATETSFDQYSAIMGSPASNMGGFLVNQRLPFLQTPSQQQPQLNFPSV
uniref:Tyrosine-protein phosphatase domain-containing protein n=1 Tax=Rodentolepis nana TaxID=102285 RepID=A0A0R3TY28_RODNA